MPTLLSTRTKQVNTYGRRRKNIISVFSPDARRVLPNENLTSDIDTDSDVPIALTTPSKTASSRLSENKFKQKPVPKPAARRVINIDTPSPARKPRPANRRVSAIKDHVSPKKYGAHKSISNILTPRRRPLASKSHNIVTSPLARDTPPVSKGKGLAPSPHQLSASQQVDIIIVDNDGEEVSTQKKAVKPKPKPRRTMRRLIIVSSDESEEDDTPKAPLRSLSIMIPPARAPAPVPAPPPVPTPTPAVDPQPKLASRPARAYVISDTDDSTDSRPALEIVLPPRRPDEKKKAPVHLAKDGLPKPLNSSRLDQEMPWNRPVKARASLIAPAPKPIPIPSASAPKSAEAARATSKHQPSASSDHLWASWDKLPASTLEYIQQTGDLQVAMPHLSPRSRKTLQTILNITAPPAVPSLDRKGKQPLRAETPPPHADLESALAELNLAGTPSTISGPLSRPTSPSPNPGPAPEPVSAPKSSHFRRLLEISSQAEPYDFSSFVSTFPFDHVHGTQAGKVAFKKVGEASFSEVFSVGNVVLKIVPISVSKDEKIPQGIEEAAWPSVSAVEDALMEIDITKAIGNVHAGFIKLITTYVIRGMYPEEFLALWDDFDDWKGSENARPHVFPPEQHYAVLVLPMGGVDLEAFDFTRAAKKSNAWRQCASIFWQVCRALAVAEKEVGFEHRDLHWGQILIKEVAVPRKSLGMRKKAPDFLPMDHATHGIKATIIDFGLARINALSGAGGAVKGVGYSSNLGAHYTVLEDVIFEGSGDYQFDVYRMMRSHNGGMWDAFRPFTNVMWLHYLTLKLLDHKHIRKPSKISIKSTASRASISTLESSLFSEQQCYQSLVLAEEMLQVAIQEDKKKRVALNKGRKSVQRGAGGESITCAGDVLKWGQRKGWITV
ncbi:hypothetical protein BOTBODRAFT_179480 [Botryobasidium botryosum FD-172 SS1]|uniref:non-specific serine/threonine protein kinase n=1 Tax=Botryobasidium botryosum (strain FD-172 SS1) TaxID=930990 RepID=A0A067M025_BOTB1|nr:hypothetical protein BOTBODRAFT_179480 [Botryobasidium botryosum FD-172 SS1]